MATYLRTPYEGKGLLLAKLARSQKCQVFGTAIAHEGMLLAAASIRGIDDRTQANVLRLLAEIYGDVVRHETRGEDLCVLYPLPAERATAQALSSLLPLHRRFESNWWGFSGWDGFLAGRVADGQDDDSVQRALTAAFQDMSLPIEITVFAPDGNDLARLADLEAWAASQIVAA